MANNNNEIKINVPEGMEIDRENSTFECIKFKKKKKKPSLPETWEEFCINTQIKDGECYIDTLGFIRSRECDCKRKFETDKNTLPNKKTAEAMLALCQLIQLRDHYNDGWEPDWKDAWESKYCIVSDGQILRRDEYHTTSRVLAFKTAELSDQFLENFRDLIEVAKPLL